MKAEDSAHEVVSLSESKCESGRIYKIEREKKITNDEDISFFVCYLTMGHGKKKIATVTHNLFLGQYFSLKDPLWLDTFGRL